MTKDEAKTLLSYHSRRNPDIHSEKWESGFLGSLRPFRGTLSDDNFKEVMECMLALADEFSKDEVSRDLVSDVVSMITLARAWSCPYGMLGRNNLVTKEQRERIFSWTDAMSAALMYLLEGDEEDARSEYDYWIEDFGGGS